MRGEVLDGRDGPGLGVHWDCEKRDLASVGKALYRRVVRLTTSFIALVYMTTHLVKFNSIHKFFGF